MFCQRHMPQPESRPPHLHEHCSRLRTPLSMLNPKLSEKDASSPPARGEEILTALSACCRQKELCNLHGAFPKVSPNSLGKDRTGFFTSISTGEAGGREAGVTDRSRRNNKVYIALRVAGGKISLPSIYLYTVVLLCHCLDVPFLATAPQISQIMQKGVQQRRWYVHTTDFGSSHQVAIDGKKGCQTQKGPWKDSCSI